MIKRFLTLAAVAALLTPSTANAAGFVELGWHSSVEAICANADCSLVQFTLNLQGLEPTDNDGAAVPAGIAGLNSPGYVQSWNIENWTGTNFASAWMVSPLASGWVAFVSNTSLILSLDTTTPFNSAPIVIMASLSGASTDGGDFTWTGLAYLDNVAGTYSSDGTAGCNASTQTCYKQGDFGGAGSTAVPEPISLTLLATGLAGVAGVARRRRKDVA